MKGSEEVVTEGNTNDVSEEKGVEEAPKSLRETLEEAYDSSVEEAPPDTGTPPDTRNEKGQFVPKAAPEPLKGATPAAPPEIIEITPPRSLPLEHREKFTSLPPELKDWLSKYEDSQYRTFSRKMGELGVKEQKYRDIDAAVAPYEIEWAKAGVSPGQVLNNYLAWEKDFHENPHKVVGELLAQKGLTLEDLAANKDSLPNPEILALRKEIADLRGAHTETQNNSIAEYNTSLNNEIESFAREVGQDGKPIRPHFDTVYAHMVQIGKHYRDNNPDASERQILEAAYRDATYLHPQVRQQLIDSEVAKKEAEKQAANSEKVKRARLAGSSLNGNPNGASMVNTKPGSLRETIEKHWEDLS